MKSCVFIAFMLCFAVTAINAQSSMGICLSDTSYVETTSAIGADGLTTNEYRLKNLPDIYIIVYVDPAHTELYMEGELINNRYEGVWLFYQNGVLTEKAQFQNGIRNGLYSSFSLEGAKIMDASFINGLMQGDLFLYHPNGLVSTHCTVTDGIPSNCVQYDSNGNSIPQQ